MAFCLGRFPPIGNPEPPSHADTRGAHVPRPPHYALFMTDAYRFPLVVYVWEYLVFGTDIPSESVADL